ncbi:putative transmembrane protein 244 [Montipora foliosa]|uniref:putative transmembrane protein 244 n=1 Tax=Montipora foliosa TaxID=591990 RepID=UPI0035F1DA53
MAEDTRVICCNLCVAIPLFFLVYYMVASLLWGAFQLNDFDGKTPFDFQNCCDVKDSKNLVNLLSLLLTYMLATVIYIIFIRKKIWDYAITVAVFHLAVSCAVMQAFPTNWEWWIAFLSSVLFMAFIGELMIRNCFSQSKETRVSPEKNEIT